MADTRISLALPTIPREPNTNKDSEVKNAYIDGSQTGSMYVVKRPGFYVGTEAITVGNARGIYVNPNAPDGNEEGETKLWYIGGTSGIGGTTGAFSLNFIDAEFTPPIPPEEEALVISADLSVNILPFDFSVAQVIYSDVGNNNGISITMTNDPTGALTGIFFAVVLETEQTIMYSSPSTDSGNYKITKTASLFYFYKDDVLQGTYIYSYTGYVNASQTEVNGSVSNLQAGTPEA